MPEPDCVIPLVQESLRLGKRRLVTGRVRIETITDIVEEIAKVDLEMAKVAIEHVPIGRVIDTVPEVRVEGEVTIIPVVEEILVVEKRLVLKEEIRVTRHLETVPVEEPVSVRRQRAVISRMPADMAAYPDIKETDMIETGSSRHLTALFDTREAAEAAADRLRALGISDARIRVTGGEEVSSRAATHRTGGFWESISDFFFPDDDRETYAEGLRRGGYLVSVSEIPEAQLDAAIDILDDEGSVDLEERSADWRAEGWEGGATPAAGLAAMPGDISTAGDADLTAAMAAEQPDVAARRYEGDTAAGSGYVAGTAPLADTGGRMDAEGRRLDEDEVIPIIEEQLRVGKRDVNLGRVRVRSYVVETPVSEEVRLRSERVEIERHPVDRAIDPNDAAFVERTIEAEEHAEEAVVQKEARVTEEIGLRKTSDERTESISDTVRHTEVEIEDERDKITREGEIRRDA